jgi:hypothetical protein
MAIGILAVLICFLLYALLAMGLTYYADRRLSRDDWSEELASHRLEIWNSD